ncbi:hypothetical protein SLI_2944 [Streptomyces lividans 1326]|uniref:Uncharacterized protein n=1 Tax=Streptomyces lividans 1326 TaxID=1200984 RepID=A0A7U9HBD8_STRLI|nr:hypothetical protein SLI_2944 [Streptomyces lividans 1326]
MDVSDPAGHLGSRSIPHPHTHSTSDETAEGGPGGGSGVFSAFFAGCR